MNLTSLINVTQRTPSKTNAFYYDAELARAFQADCEELLEKFENYKNFSFTTFAIVWKNANFLAIFKDMEYIMILQAFIDNCFYVTKKFLFSNDPYIQVGAVYILYSLYYKQPIKEYVKIRLITTEVEKLTEIVNFHKANNSLDVVYIYHKMLLDSAFHYCAFSHPLTLKSSLQIDLNKDSINRHRSRHNIFKKFRNFVESASDLSQFQQTDDEYQKLAHKYKKDLFVFPSGLGSALNKAKSAVFNTNLEEKSESEVKSKQTKSKAMGNMNAKYRGERGVITALDLEEASTSKIS